MLFLLYLVAGRFAAVGIFYLYAVMSIAFSVIPFGYHDVILVTILGRGKFLTALRRFPLRRRQASGGLLYGGRRWLPLPRAHCCLCWNPLLLPYLWRRSGRGRAA